MNNKFILFDKNNNIEKDAQLIVKFNFENNNYLVYSIEENEQNSQIFVSKLVLNSEGNSFIDDISLEEKGKLSNIVYNIVILIPSDIEKGTDFQTLINNLFNKFSVKLLSGLPTLSNQEYYSNCSIAITNNSLVKNALDLYNEKLNVVNETITTDVPTWTAPVEVTAPTPIDGENIPTIEEPTIVSSSIPVVDPIISSNGLESNMEKTSDASVSLQNVVVPEVESPSLVVEEPAISSDNNVTTPSNDINSSSDVILPNPQTEKLAIVSDPSLGIGIQQPNIMQNKKAGFANTKYVVIGTICLVLAIAVIITAYILIKNLG